MSRLAIAAIITAFWLLCVLLIGLMLLISDHWWLSLPLDLIVVAYLTRKLIKDIRGLQ